MNQIIFSGFDNGKSPNKNWEIPIKKLIKKIKSSEILKEKTETIRHLGAEMKRLEAKINEFQNRKDDDPEKITVEADFKKVEKEYKDLKGKLPLITIHAYFEQGRKNTDPHTYTGVILADIDHITEEEADKLLIEVKKRPYVLFANISVSGKGLHIIVCVDVEGGINDENFKDVFKVTTQFVDYDLNIETDKAVGSISRCMFLNWDENIYYNPEVTPLDINSMLWLEENNNKLLNTKENA